MVKATEERGLKVVATSGDALSCKNTFDAVFSNAALHWMTDYNSVIKRVHTALKPKGRFVGELGGHGNIAALVHAMKTVVDANIDMGKFQFFPKADEYRYYLENHGFSVNYIELFPRPTLLRSGVGEWLKIFANHLISGMPLELEEEFLTTAEKLLKPVLYSVKDGWFADYVRLRFCAVKT